MGYIIEYLLKKQLTVVEQFHSHLEPMKFLSKDTFHEQVSFSYSKGPRDEWNILKIDGFDMKDDPKRALKNLFKNNLTCVAQEICEDLFFYALTWRINERRLPSTAIAVSIHFWVFRKC
ncbi:Fringe glycosyltransferase [Acromyrmex echinatior]|uniref:Fringe glycosyltransferase n=1 Tax=Acromyrmex echinatior TaxID=103372 RepID=F4W511_ACREC|nr:Fringe glycosyltransferase [Acromyrmex echinatior]